MVDWSQALPRLVWGASRTGKILHLFREDGRSECRSGTVVLDPGRSRATYPAGCGGADGKYSPPYPAARCCRGCVSIASHRAWLARRKAAQAAKEAARG